MSADDRAAVALVAVPSVAVLGLAARQLVDVNLDALVGPMLHALAGVAVVAFVLVGGAGLAFPRRAQTRTVRVHTHGGHGTRHAAKHEAGHRKVARALGMRLGRSCIYPDGSGWTDVHVPAGAPPEHDVALSVAGRLASGTSKGCGGPLWLADKGSDNWHVRRVLNGQPRDRRDATRTAGEQLARRCLSGGVRAEADRLYRDGSV